MKKVVFEKTYLALLIFFMNFSLISCNPIETSQAISSAISVVEIGVSATRVGIDAIKEKPTKANYTSEELPGLTDYTICTEFKKNSDNMWKIEAKRRKLSCY